MILSKLRLLGVLLFLACSALARADSITFNVSGSLGDGATLGGTLKIDTTAGTVTAVNITVGAPDLLQLTQIAYQNNNYGPGYSLIFASNAANTAELNFIIHSSLVGYTGGSGSNANIYYQSTGVYGAQGILTLSLPPVPPPAVAPEPPSFVLLGTALAAGVCVAVYRRRMRAVPVTL